MTSSTGCSGLTLRGIAAEPHDAVAHRREIDDAGTPVKSCSSTRAGVNAISFCVARRDVPAGQRLDVVRVDEPRVLAAQQVLEQDLQRIRQAGDVRETGLLERGQAEDVERVGPRP